jgi:hypothetical protein
VCVGRVGSSVGLDWLSIGGVVDRWRVVEAGSVLVGLDPWLGWV